MGRSTGGERVHQGGGGGYGLSRRMKRGERGHHGAVPEKGGPDRGQESLKQHKILRQYQGLAFDRFACNALVRCSDILCFPLQDHDHGSGIKVMFFVGVVSLAGLYNTQSTLLHRQSESNAACIFISEILTFCVTAHPIETLAPQKAKILQQHSCLPIC